jgi:hypothetical protein
MVVAVVGFSLVVGLVMAVLAVVVWAGFKTKSRLLKFVGHAIIFILVLYAVLSGIFDVISIPQSWRLPQQAQESPLAVLGAPCLTFLTAWLGYTVSKKLGLIDWLAEKGNPKGRG